EDIPMIFLHTAEDRSRSLGRHRQLVFPLWFPSVLFAIWPAFAAAGAWRRWRALRRVRRGLCAGCGYDVRANKTECSECGRPIAIIPPPVILPRQSATAAAYALLLLLIAFYV